MSLQIGFLDRPTLVETREVIEVMYGAIMRCGETEIDSTHFSSRSEERNSPRPSASGHRIGVLTTPNSLEQI